MNPRIDQSIAQIVVAPHMLLIPTTNKVVADAALRSAWVNRTPPRGSRTGVDGSTPGDMGPVVRVKHSPSPVLIIVVGTSPLCGINGVLQVVKKWQSTSPYVVSNKQKLDAGVDQRLPDDLDYASIFSKVIVHKLSDGSGGYLYLRCRMNFVADVFQTKAPQFMDLGLLAINT